MSTKSGLFLTKGRIVMKIDLKKLKEVGEKATKGRWESADDGMCFIAHQISEDGDVDFQLLKSWDRKEDCDFSCEARNNWEEIIQALEAFKNCESSHEFSLLQEKYFKEGEE